MLFPALYHTTTTVNFFVFSEKNVISIWNDGKGIPVIEHKVEKLYVPEMIFGHLLTSSNFSDEDKKVTGKINFISCFIHKKKNKVWSGTSILNPNKQFYCSKPDANLNEFNFSKPKKFCFE